MSTTQSVQRHNSDKWYPIRRSLALQPLHVKLTSWSWPFLSVILQWLEKSVEEIHTRAAPGQLSESKSSFALIFRRLMPLDFDSWPRIFAASQWTKRFFTNFHTRNPVENRLSTFIHHSQPSDVCVKDTLKRTPSVIHEFHFSNVNLEILLLANENVKKSTWISRCHNFLLKI